MIKYLPKNIKFIINTMCVILILMVCCNHTLACLENSDGLRNIKRGDTIPEYSLQTIEGKTYSSTQNAGKATVMIYLAAEQKSSERVSSEAHDIVNKIDKGNKELNLIYITADVANTNYFRNYRDQTDVHNPLLLDMDREVYGSLGLIVLPTTIIINNEGKLAQVISSYRPDYSHILESYILHTTGKISDEELEKSLVSKSYHRDSNASKATRHRAAASLLCSKKLYKDAEKELNSALELDPENVDVKLDLAHLHLIQKNVADAKKLVDEVLAVKPTSKQAKLMNGITLYFMDDLDQAEKVLTEVIMLNPDPARTHYYLGLIYEKKGETTKAMNHYRQALGRLLDEPAI